MFLASCGFSQKCMHALIRHCSNTLPYMQRKLRRDYWFCGKEEADNGCVNLSSRESLRGKWPVQSSAARSLWGGIHTYKHTHTLLYKDREEREALDEDTKKTNWKLRSNGPRGRCPICCTLSTARTSTESWQTDLAKVKSYLREQLIPASGSRRRHHKDDNLIVINSCTVQLVPQQVSDVDRGAHRVSHCVLTTCAAQNEE